MGATDGAVFMSLHTPWGAKVINSRPRRNFIDREVVPTDNMTS